MAIDPPYRLDPFRNIVNVHWEESTFEHHPAGCATELWTTVFVGADYGSLIYPVASGPVGQGDNNTIELLEENTQYGMWGTLSGSISGPPYQSFERFPDFGNFTITPPSGGLSVTWQIRNDETGKVGGTYTSDFSSFSFRNYYCGTYRASRIDWGPLQYAVAFGPLYMGYFGKLWFA